MLFKLRNVIFCGSIIFFMINGDIALAADVKSKKQSTPAVSANTKVSFKITTPVNVNKADVETLQQMRWMSKRKAQAIVDYRTENGPFKSLEDLLQVKCRGIHKAWLDKVRKYFTV